MCAWLHALLNLCAELGSAVPALNHSGQFSLLGCPPEAFHGSATTEWAHLPAGTLCGLRPCRLGRTLRAPTHRQNAITHPPCLAPAWVTTRRDPGQPNTHKQRRNNQQPTTNTQQQTTLDDPGDGDDNGNGNETKSRRDQPTNNPTNGWPRRLPADQPTDRTD